MRLLLSFSAILLLATLASGQVILPTLPQATVSLTLPTQGGSTCPTLTTGSNCIRNVPSGDATNFQNAINASTCGDTIVLVAGSTYSGNFTIPSTVCSGWIEIQSSAMGSLPSSGTRVGPSNASNMPIISTPNTAPAVLILPNANHWRFMGLEITTSYVSTSSVVYNLVMSGRHSDASTQDTLAEMPSYLTFDRDYIVGLSTTNADRGVLMDSYSMAIVDSYCDEIHTNNTDAQCFSSVAGPGPYLIQNNFVQASTENIMFGGADPVVTNLVPSDITIIGNLIQKNQTWNGQGAPYNWVVKNLFELKNAQRVLLDGNVIQYTWAAGQQEALILRSVNQDGSCSWCVVQDITVTHNIIRHAPMGIEITPMQGPPASSAVPTQRILIQNNLLTDLSSATWGNPGTLYELGASDTTAQMHDITINHNTGFSDIFMIELGIDGSPTIPNFQFTNNISDLGTTGVWATGGKQGANALNTYAPGYVWNDDTQIGTNPGGYPSGSFWSAIAGIGFTSYSGTDPNISGNLQLTGASAYHNAGTDGRDIGVWDWLCLNATTAAALAGTYSSTTTCYDGAPAFSSSLQGVTIQGGVTIQ